MAASSRSLSNDRIAGAGRESGRQKSGILRRRSDTRYVGLPTADHSGVRSDARNDATETLVEELVDEVAVLAEVLATSGGSLARELSANLINRFGSIAAVLASSQELRTCGIDIPDRVANSLANMAHAICQGWKKIAMDGQVLSSSAALHQYLRMDMATHKCEHFRVLFLNSENRLLADRTMWRGTVDAVQVHPREIVRAAIDIGATALILVHNHPGGSAEPSGQDNAITEKIISACKALDIHVHDHIIVAPSATFSMRTGKPFSF